ncbi:transcriptional regulator [Synergistales bacterium]|nr:transcriptional regulator [Synergistales bacterium]
MSIFANNGNMSLVSRDSKNGVTIEVFEYKSLTPSTPSQGMAYYFAEKEGLKLRQCVVTLSGQDGVQLSPGAMSYMLGAVDMTTGITGVGDFAKKLLTSHVTGEKAIKPLYKGTGEVGLEPSFRHYIVAELDNEEFCLDDGLFYAASEGIKITAKRNSLTTAIAGGEGGLFQLAARGTGLLVLESKVPMNEISVVELDNSVLKVDGNFAMLWSGSLQQTVERSGKTLIGSAASGEGLVNVFRGKGMVWLATTLVAPSFG